MGTARKKLFLALAAGVFVLGLAGLGYAIKSGKIRPRAETLTGESGVQVPTPKNPKWVIIKMPADQLQQQTTTHP